MPKIGLKTNLSCWRVIFIPFILILLVFILLSCSQTTGQPLVKAGILDLSEWTAPEAETGFIELKGQWRFFWEKPESMDFQSLDRGESGGEMINVPGSWNGIEDSNYPDHGYGWYLLDIKNSTFKNPALFFRTNASALTVYVNGKKITRLGHASALKNESVPVIGSFLAALPESEDYQIACFISNFDDINGGLTLVPRFGNSLALTVKLNQESFDAAFTLGLIFVMIVFHIIMWWLQKSNYASLYFMFFCIIIFVRYLGGTCYSTGVFHPQNIFAFFIRIQYLSTNLGVLFFLLFLTSLFPDEFKNTFFNVLKIILIFLSVFMFFPPDLFTTILIVFQLALVISCVCIIIFLIIALKRKRESSEYVMTGFIILFIATLHDLASAQLPEYSLSLVQHALVIFLFLQSYITLHRFIRAYHTADHLSKNLQKEVVKQTKEIESQKEELVRINTERTNFFINFAHETKTPVTLMHNYLEKHIKNHGPTKELKIVRQNMIGLKTDMINYLDMEKLLKGKEIYNNEQLCCFSTLLEDAEVLFIEAAGKKNIQFTSDIKKDVYVQADPLAIIRIINNLVDNAVHYTPEKGKVSITLSMDEDFCIFIVRNTGEGIAPEEQINIFKPFYQITRKKRNPQGIGMGLAIVKMIVDELNASVSLESSPGSWTEFTVKIKIIEKTSNMPDNTPAAFRPFKPRYESGIDEIHQGTFDAAGKNIFLVEDNKEMLAYLNDSLEEKYNVMFACNGAEALEILNKIDILPDLIISDIMMDVMNGYVFFEKLKKNIHYAAVPFIFLSAKNDSNSRLVGLGKGAVDFISKPFDMEELDAKIHSVLKNREAMVKNTKQAFISKLANYIGENNKPDLDEKLLEYDLSLRECDVAKLVIKGMQNKEIADTLSISVSMVKKHINSIFAKCNVKRRIEFIKLMKR